MVDAYLFAIAALATARLTLLVTRDRGPIRMFETLRHLAPYYATCPACVSIAAAAATWLAIKYFPTPTDDVLHILALSLTTYFFYPAGFRPAPSRIHGIPVANTKPNP